MLLATLSACSPGGQENRLQDAKPTPSTWQRPAVPMTPRGKGTRQPTAVAVCSSASREHAPHQPPHADIVNRMSTPTISSPPRRASAVASAPTELQQFAHESDASNAPTASAAACTGCRRRSPWPNPPDRHAQAGPQRLSRSGGHAAHEAHMHRLVLLTASRAHTSSPRNQ